MGRDREGIIHIEVADNTNAMSWMSKKRANRGIDLKLLSTFLAWAIHMRLKLDILYPRTYRNVSADALTRNTVGPIEDWALEQGFTWIDIPGILEEFCLSAIPGALSLGCDPICLVPRSDL